MRQYLWRRRILVPLIAVAGFAGVSFGQAAASSIAAPAVAVRIGTSLENRPLDVMCVGTGTQTVLIVGGVHTGPEVITSVLAQEIAVAMQAGDLSLPATVRLCVLPTLNLDGLALDQRTNANRVDLNRNWPDADWKATAFHSGPVGAGAQPLSEPETRALHEYILHERPDVVLMLHCCGDLVEANEVPGASHLATVYAAGASLAYIEEWKAYPITGQFIDSMEQHGIPAMDIEMHSQSNTGYAAHRAGLVALTYYLATNPPDLRGAPSTLR